jgi:hypothetical protein
MKTITVQRLADLSYQASIFVPFLNRDVSECGYTEDHAVGNLRWLLVERYDQSPAIIDNAQVIKG